MSVWPAILWNQQTEFLDLSEPFELRYKERENLGGHMFCHVMDGLYMAEDAFPVTEEQSWELQEEYPEIQFSVCLGNIRFAWSDLYSRNHSIREWCNALKDKNDPELMKIRELLWAAMNESCVNRDFSAIVSGKKLPDRCSFFIPEEYDSQGYPKHIFIQDFMDDENTSVIAAAGYPKHIFMDGFIGYMFMPGIYYFSPNESGKRPHIDRNIRMGRKIAVIGQACFGYGVSKMTVEYLAVDEENIEILKEIQRGMGGSIHEFPMQKTNSEQKWIAYQELEEPKVPENSVEELVPGIGIRHIQVGLKYIFLPKIDITEYSYAYKEDEKLVLINEINIRKEYDLCMLEELVVRRKEKLKCGLSMDRYYILIDCCSEKERELLGPECYKRYQKVKEGMLGK